MNIWEKLNKDDLVHLEKTPELNQMRYRYRLYYSEITNKTIITITHQRFVDPNFNEMDQLIGTGATLMELLFKDVVLLTINKQENFLEQDVTYEYKFRANFYKEKQLNDNNIY